jgi:hypothetical protein
MAREERGAELPRGIEASASPGIGDADQHGKHCADKLATAWVGGSVDGWPLADLFLSPAAPGAPENAHRGMYNGWWHVLDVAHYPTSGVARVDAHCVAPDPTARSARW